MANQMLSILQHSIGANQHGQGGGHRNHFVTGEGSVDHPHCVAAVEQGLMFLAHMNKQLTGGGDCFSVTAAGLAYIAEHSPPAPPPRKRTKYDDFLDADCNESFAEFMGITKPKLEFQGRYSNRQYRMVRRVSWWNRGSDVIGEWSSTKGGAKASYKAKLKAACAAKKGASHG